MADRFTTLRAQGWDGTLAQMEAKLENDSTSQNAGTTRIKRPKISGSRGGNVALKDLPTALDTLGIVKDNTTA